MSSKALASYSRVLALKGSAWEVGQLVAARVEVAAWERAHESLECSRVVAERALSAQEEP